MFHKRKSGTLAIAFATFCSLLISVGSVSAKKAKPQGLWVGQEHDFAEFQGKALQKSGTPKPHLDFGSEVFNAPFSMAFDGHDDLWAVFQTIDDNIFPALEVPHGDFVKLQSGGSAKAKLITVLRSGSTNQFVVPVSIDFDAAGNMWLVDDGMSVVELHADQLKKTSTQTPALTLVSQVATPSYLRFDASNNLWVVEFPVPFDQSETMIWRYTAADRAAGQSATPSLIVNLPDQIAVIGDFAFDSAGDLWIPAIGSQGQEIEMISASDLSGSGEISPSTATIVTSSAFQPFGGSGQCLQGIDFDHAGDAWVVVTDNCNPAVISFTASQMSAGGNQTPSVTLSPNAKRTNIFIPGPLRFGPTVP